jgi:HlyD family secretion protein
MLYRPSTRARDKSPERPAIAREFQSPATAFEDDEPAKSTRWVLYALTAFVLATALWASLASVDEIVTARGELVTSVPALVVQPLERVGIKSVYVKVGDIVRKGQVLASLDPTFTEADVEQLRTRLAAYSARQARLEAELAGMDYALPPSPSPGGIAIQRTQGHVCRSRAIL